MNSDVNGIYIYQGLPSSGYCEFNTENTIDVYKTIKPCTDRRNQVDEKIMILIDDIINKKQLINKNGLFTKCKGNMFLDNWIVNYEEADRACLITLFTSFVAVGQQISIDLSQRNILIYFIDEYLRPIIYSVSMSANLLSINTVIKELIKKEPSLIQTIKNKDIPYLNLDQLIFMKDEIPGKNKKIGNEIIDYLVTIIDQDTLNRIDIHKNPRAFEVLSARFHAKSFLLEKDIQPGYNTFKISQKLDELSLTDDAETNDRIKGLYLTYLNKQYQIPISIDFLEKFQTEEVRAIIKKKFNLR